MSVVPFLHQVIQLVFTQLEILSVKSDSERLNVLCSRIAVSGMGFLIKINIHILTFYSLRPQMIVRPKWLLLVKDNKNLFSSHHLNYFERQLSSGYCCHRSPPQWHVHPYLCFGNDEKSLKKKSCSHTNIQLQYEEQFLLIKI